MDSQIETKLKLINLYGSNGKIREDIGKKGYGIVEKYSTDEILDYYKNGIFTRNAIFGVKNLSSGLAKIGTFFYHFILTIFFINLFIVILGIIGNIYMIDTIYGKIILLSLIIILAFTLISIILEPKKLIKIQNQNSLVVLEKGLIYEGKFYEYKFFEDFKSLWDKKESLDISEKDSTFSNYDQDFLKFKKSGIKEAFEQAIPLFKIVFNYITLRLVSCVIIIPAILVAKISISKVLFWTAVLALIFSIGCIIFNIFYLNRKIFFYKFFMILKKKYENSSDLKNYFFLKQIDKDLNILEKNSKKFKNFDQQFFEKNFDENLKISSQKFFSIKNKLLEIKKFNIGLEKLNSLVNSYFGNVLDSYINLLKTTLSDIEKLDFETENINIQLSQTRIGILKPKIEENILKLEKLKSLV